MSWAMNPVPIPSASCTKKRNSATPIAISGVMNEKSITKFAVPEPRPCHRSSASAKATPSGTAMATVRVESFRLCASAGGARVVPDRGHVAHVPLRREPLPGSERAGGVERKEHGDHDRKSDQAK